MKFIDRFELLIILLQNIITNLFSYYIFSVGSSKFPINWISLKSLTFYSAWFFNSCCFSLFHNKCFGRIHKKGMIYLIPDINIFHSGEEFSMHFSRHFIFLLRVPIIFQFFRNTFKVIEITNLFLLLGSLP